jgi:ArsR family transcriptional regulator
LYRLVRSPAREWNAGGESEDALPPKGDGDDLSMRVADWIAAQALPPSIRVRLASVIGAREDQSRKFFDRVGRQWDDLREASFGSCFHLEAFLSLLPHEWSVLDVGAGTGYLLPVLARQFTRVVAVEPAEAMLGVARRRVESLRLENVELHSGDVTALPIEDGSMDLVIAVLVLHHVPSPTDALGELRRVLRPGGKLLIVEQTAHQNADFCERMQDQWWGFDPAEFAGWTRTAGFDSVETRTLATVVRADDAPDLFVISARRTA